jgi:inosine triphosphate pyrophosphatase
MHGSITFITGNPHKAEQLEENLGFPVQSRQLDIAEIQSLDPAEVAEAKVRAAYEKLGIPVLVEDTSIRFTALGKLPGPYIKAFIEELGAAGICKILDCYDDRGATVETQFALFDGTELLFFKSSMLCTVADQPRGADGIGTDSILIPEGSTKTWGEMDKEEQTKTSVRMIAIGKLANYLNGRRQ